MWVIWCFLIIPKTEKHIVIIPAMSRQNPNLIPS